MSLMYPRAPLYNDCPYSATSPAPERVVLKDKAGATLEELFGPEDGPHAKEAERWVFEAQFSEAA